MSAASEFMKRNKPLRKSKLADYQNDINILLTSSYTVAQVHEFLITEKVEVSRDYLYRYCQKIRSTPIVIESEKQEAPKPESKKETPVQVVALKKMDQQQEEKKDAATATDADDIINYVADKDEDDMTADEMKIHRKKESAKAVALMNKLKESPDYGKKRIIQVWKPTEKFA